MYVCVLVALMTFIVLQFIITVWHCLSLSFQEEAPLYRSLEKKIESMTECSQIQHDIKKTIDDPSPLYGRGFRDLHTHLELLRDEYMNKSSKWSEILNTNGR